MKQIFFIVIIFFLLGLNAAKAQQSYDSSFHFYYYDQKLSMFQAMKPAAKCIVFLGDSITDSCEWAELLSGKKVINRGISSDNTFGVINRMDEVIRHRPSKLFLMIGINDISRNIPEEVIVKNISRIIAIIQQQSPATKIYLQSILPTNEAFTNFPKHQNKQAQILSINIALQKIANEKKLVFVNLFEVMKDTNGRLDKTCTNDGLHLNAEGYRRWKEFLLQNKYI